MAPEQARGAAVDSRADLFSLGCVLYQMATGRQPFTGKDTMAILYALANENPLPPQMINPALPLPLAELITQLLTKDPAYRPASAREVAERLEAVERQRATSRAAGQGMPAAPVALKLPTPPLATPLPTGWLRRFRATSFITGTVAVLLLASVGIVLMLSFPTKGPQSGLGGGPPPVDLVLKVEPLGGKLDPAGKLLLKLNDKIGFRVQVNRDCYLGVFVTDDRGRITTLFPNRDEMDNLVRASQPRTIPGKPEYWIEALEVSRGPESIRVIASIKHWEPPPGHRGPDDRFTTYENEAQRNELEMTLRAIGIVRPDPNKKDHQPGVSEEIIPFQVRPAD
jgi:hypothetical protein